MRKVPAAVANARRLTWACAHLFPILHWCHRAFGLSAVADRMIQSWVLRAVGLMALARLCLY